MRRWAGFSRVSLAALVVVSISACRSRDDVPGAVDRCAAHAVRTTTSWHTAHFSGITLQVPRGWYSVKACFAVVVDEADRSFVPPVVPTTRIDARPASLPDSASPASDASGGRYEMTAQIRQRDRNVLVISAYLGTDDQAERDAVLRVMRSVRHTG